MNKIEHKKVQLPTRVRKVKGQITCNTNQLIPEGSVLTTNVKDISLMDVPAIYLGTQKILNPKQFPINFEFEYDTSKSVGLSYAIDARIELNGKLIFCNDTNFGLEHSNFQTKNFHVVEVK